MNENQLTPSQELFVSNDIILPPRSIAITPLKAITYEQIRANEPRIPFIGMKRIALFQIRVAPSPGSRFTMESAHTPLTY